MKFVEKIPKKKPKPQPKSIEITESDARVRALTPIALWEWYVTHNQCRLGMTTSAYLGMQWDSCRNYHEVSCKCGSTAIMETAKSPVVITQGEIK